VSASEAPQCEGKERSALVIAGESTSRGRDIDNVLLEEQKSEVPSI
jgi:hypothetical protein